MSSTKIEESVSSTLPEWAREIRTIRKALGMDQKQLAEALQVTQAAVSKWESGASEPGVEMFAKIGRLAKRPDQKRAIVSLIYEANPNFRALIDESESQRGPSQPKLVNSGTVPIDTGELRPIPLLRDAIAAGEPRAIDERDIDRYLMLPKQWLRRGGNIFAVTVTGESMLPIIAPGYTMFVDVTQRDPRKLEKKMVAARQGSGLTVKWLRRDGDIWLLVPQHTSPDYPVRVMRPEGDYSIVGEVVAWIGTPPVRK